MYVSKAGAYQSESVNQELPLRVLALPTNIRLGWKGLAGANTLACNVDSLITAETSVITLAPRSN